MVALICGMLALAFYISTKPLYSNVVVKTTGQEPRSFSFPYLEKYIPPQGSTLTFGMRLGRIHPTVYTAYFRDFVGFIEVNSHRVVDLTKVPRELDDLRVDLGPYLHEGDNIVRVRLVSGRNVSYFYWQPSTGDPIVIISLILGCGAIASLLFGLHLRYPAFFRSRETIILGMALAVRLVYLAGTTNSSRANDWEDHFQYVEYIAVRHALPPLNYNPETYQPPLYYSFAGAIGACVFQLGRHLDVALFFWQLTSYLLIGLSLFATLWIANQLFPEPSSQWRAWFLAGLAAVPAFAFFTTWISNQVLFALISFLFIGTLLSFWRNPQWRSLIALGILVALGLITKSNSLVFIPVVLTSVMLASHFSMRQKAGYLAGFLVVVALLSGWYLIKRALESSDASSFMVASLSAIPEREIIHPTLASMLTFNPLKVIHQPFTWVGSGPRRWYFPEFFFQSALFNEWLMGSRVYQALARGIAVFAMVLVPFIPWGMIRVLRSTALPSWPLAVTIFGFLSAQIAFTLKAPYDCHQNFRQSITILAPLFYFLIKGIEASPRSVQLLGIGALAGFISLSTIFILMMPGVLG